MAKKIYDDVNISAIAEKIREKAGTSKKYSTKAMPEGVGDVYQKGYNEGLEYGRKSEYDAFWDAVQENGNKTDYYFAFAGRSWDNNFRPKYSIRPTNAAYIFGYWSKGSHDLVELCNELGIEIDFSNATSMGSLFVSNTVVTRIGTIDARKATHINSAFQYCSALHTIEKLMLKENGGTAFNAELFRNCSSLVNLTIEGVIGQANFNLQWSTKLSADSIDSVIYALSTTTSGLAITFSKAAVDAACKVMEGSHYYDSTNSLWWAIRTAEKSNWTISLV